MSRAPAILLLSLALAGCAATPQAHLAADPAARPARFAWDGGGEDPNRPRISAETSRAARTAAKPSQDGTGLDDEHDAQLSRSLVICKGCLRPQPQPSDDARLAKASN
ncbi:hypothetical protein JQ596_22375 [Bradyrhizobium manausense]|uniref:hypothetical protein n=1 Tax=Bradyrhizobium TaxID=374 RepID=UPI001BAB8A07|nr:hypothetical protein [Bradyrhizobium manausense]UVO33354.1 hypothetical protein KUF59_23925 [Bradyrhizobium arachidis]